MHSLCSRDIYYIYKGNIIFSLYLSFCFQTFPQNMIKMKCFFVRLFFFFFKFQAIVIRIRKKESTFTEYIWHTRPIILSHNSLTISIIIFFYIKESYLSSGWRWNLVVLCLPSMHEALADHQHYKTQTKTTS
jgi:hypothetical protein